MKSTSPTLKTEILHTVQYVCAHTYQSDAPLITQTLNYFTNISIRYYNIFNGWSTIADYSSKMDIERYKIKLCKK